MNKSRIFNEVGDLYEASIINEGKSRFPVQAPGIGKGTFDYQKNKKVVPAISKGTKAYVQQDSGPDHEGAKTLLPVKHETDPVAAVDEDGKLSVYDGDKFTTARNPEYNSYVNKKVKKFKKIQKKSINNSMTKSIFDKLYETVMNEEGIPGDDNIEAHDANALDLPVDGEGDEVTITLDREMAKKLHEVLMTVLGDESANDEHEDGGEDTEGEDAEGEDSESHYGEATELEEVKIPGTVHKGGKHPWEVGHSNIVKGDASSDVDGEEGEGSVNNKVDGSGKPFGKPELRKGGTADTQKVPAKPTPVDSKVSKSLGKNLFAAAKGSYKGSNSGNVVPRDFRKS